MKKAPDSLEKKWFLLSFGIQSLLILAAGLFLVMTQTPADSLLGIFAAVGGLYLLAFLPILMISQGVLLALSFVVEWLESRELEQTAQHSPSLKL